MTGNPRTWTTETAQRALQLLNNRVTPENHQEEDHNSSSHELQSDSEFDNPEFNSIQNPKRHESDAADTPYSELPESARRASPEPSFCRSPSPISIPKESVEPSPAPNSPVALPESWPAAQGIKDDPDGPTNHDDPDIYNHDGHSSICANGVGDENAIQGSAEWDAGVSDLLLSPVQQFFAGSPEPARRRPDGPVDLENYQEAISTLRNPKCRLTSNSIESLQAVVIHYASNHPSSTVSHSLVVDPGWLEVANRLPERLPRRSTSFDVLYAVLHHAEEHWTLVRFDFVASVCEHYDPLPAKKRFDETWSCIGPWIQRQTGVKFSVKRLPGPVQEDATSCGAFVLAALQSLLVGEPIDIPTTGAITREALARKTEEYIKAQSSCGAASTAELLSSCVKHAPNVTNRKRHFNTTKEDHLLVEHNRTRPFKIYKSIQIQTDSGHFTLQDEQESTGNVIRQCAAHLAQYPPASPSEVKEVQKRTATERAQLQEAEAQLQRQRDELHKLESGESDLKSELNVEVSRLKSLLDVTTTFNSAFNGVHENTDVAKEAITEMQKMLLLRTELQKTKTVSKSQELNVACNMTTAARISASDSEVEVERVKCVLAETDRRLQLQKQKEHMAMLVSIGQGGGR
ncbi:hypothetical protein CSUB01_09127 [Colletotrichum sublineola]|uniref:Ubiquitin-like protease family profile domain-containing protein n=1 Tax=Colletotrichum sublineola TaxID=1173701 RepID=A0A066XWT5_COLSU|nr:hypothetical protein CSUB01_09127 [Colletotrichum sublineola]